MFRILLLLMSLTFPSFKNAFKTDIECRNGCFYKNKESIKRDVEQRFVGAYILAVHGDGKEGEEWHTLPDDGHETALQRHVNQLREKYPGRPIVLWSCNPGHATIKGKNVWYFKNRAWVIPDSAMIFVHMDDRGIMMDATEQRDVKEHFGGDGSVFDMVEGESD